MTRPPWRTLEWSGTTDLKDVSTWSRSPEGLVRLPERRAQRSRTSAAVRTSDMTDARARQSQLS